MAFRPISSTRSDIAEINMIPLIDVMLVLLIIFMIAAPLMTSKIFVDLPQAKANSSVDAKPMIVTLDEQGKVWFDNNPIALSELAQNITQAKTRGVDQLHLHADKNVRYNVVAHVMSVAQSEGIIKIGFVTNQPN